MDFKTAKDILGQLLREFKPFMTSDELIGNIITCHITGSFNVDISGNIINFKPFTGADLKPWLAAVGRTYCDDLEIQTYDTWTELHDRLEENFETHVGDIELYMHRNIMYVEMLNGTITSFEISGF